MELIEDIMVNYPKDWKELNLRNLLFLKQELVTRLTTAEYLDNGEYFLITGTDFKNVLLTGTIACLLRKV